MLNVGKSLTTDVIFDHVWQDEEDVDASIVWIYISYLREKLEAIDADVEIIGEKGEEFILSAKEKAD
jgi:DNA-binding response OmpR family regulator